MGFIAEGQRNTLERVRDGIIGASSGDEEESEMNPFVAYLLNAPLLGTVLGTDFVLLEKKMQ